jgi:hypothetical protein
MSHPSGEKHWKFCEQSDKYVPTHAKTLKVSSTAVMMISHSCPRSLEPRSVCGAVVTMLLRSPRMANQKD